MTRHLRGETKTCPHCGREISRYPVTNVPMHVEMQCPERPDREQAGLERWSA